MTDLAANDPLPKPKRDIAPILLPVALALLKRAVPPDAELDADGVAAAIDPRTVPDQAGPQAGREAVRRLRGG